MGGACPKQADRPEYDIYAACNFAWFLKRSNVELNVQHIESAIQQVRRWHWYPCVCVCQG